MTPSQHQSLVIGFAMGAALLGALLPTLTIATQFWLILVPVAIFGLSHGGADPLILKSLLRTREGPRMWFAIAGYVTLAAAFVGLIWWQPVLSLICFIVLSLWHFGRTDLIALSNAEAAEGAGLAQSTRVVLAGALPIAGPVYGHPNQTGELFAWLLATEVAPVIALTTELGIWLAGLWLLGFVAFLAKAPCDVDVPVYLELLSVAVAMVMLPPLLAFTFYFCGVHSIRHFMAVARHTPNRDHAGTLRFLALQATPATLAALVLAVVAWGLIVTLSPESGFMMEAVRILFWGLAALTVPHVVTVELWWLRGLNNVNQRT